MGTMSIPNPLGAAAAQEALDYFSAAGFDEIDSAILYQEGATEATLGEEKTVVVAPTASCLDGKQKRRCPATPFPKQTPNVRYSSRRCLFFLAKVIFLFVCL